MCNWHYSLYLVVPRLAFLLEEGAWKSKWMAQPSPNDLIPVPKILKWTTVFGGLLKWKEVTRQCKSFPDLQSPIRTGSSTWVHPWRHHTDLQILTGYNIVLLNMLQWFFFLSACLGHKAHKTRFSISPFLSPLSTPASFYFLSLASFFLSLSLQNTPFPSQKWLLWLLSITPVYSSSFITLTIPEMILACVSFITSHLSSIR